MLNDSWARADILGRRNGEDYRIDCVEAQSGRTKTRGTGSYPWFMTHTLYHASV